MARHRAQSVARIPRTQQPGLNGQLRAWLAHELAQLKPAIAASAAESRANRYRKTFSAFAHACLLIFHGLSRGPSLRQSYAAFATCRGLVTISGLALPEAEDPQGQYLAVGYSQFAASNTTRPAAFLGLIIPTLVARVRASGRLPDTKLPANLHLFDSTFLRLSLVLAPWLPNVGKKDDVPGVRVHVQYAPALDLPEHVLVTDTRTTDRRAFDQWLLDDPFRLGQLRDHTLVIDLGYYGHRRFARLLAASVHFVSRLLLQASFRVEADLPIQQPLPGMYPERIAVLSDQRITLGSPANSAGAVLPGLRLVKAQVTPLPKAARQGAKPVVYQILTDRWDLSAADAVQIYLWRWQIELLFRWLKSHVQLPRLLGYSPNAVELTVWLAIVVHLLSVLAARFLGWARRSPTLLSRLLWALAQLANLADESPSPEPTQLALPEYEPMLATPT